MATSPGQPAATLPPVSRPIELALVVAMVVLHFGWLLCFHEPAINSPDADGYYAQIPQLVHHGRTELGVESPLQHIGLQWLHVGDGRFYSRYTPGVAVLLAPFYLLLGPDLALYVTPLMASLTLALLFFLCRPWVGTWLALLGAALYGLQPDAATHALNWGAHTQVAFVLLAGLLCLDRWARAPDVTWRALLAGLCLGTVPTLRPAEVVLGLGVLAFLAHHTLPSDARPQRRGAMVAAVGALIPLAALAGYNTSIFGGPATTAYSLTGEQQLGTGFALAYFLDKWRPMLDLLLSRSGILFFALGVPGVAAMFLKRQTRAMAWLLAGIIVPLTVLYTAYYWGGGNTVQTSGIRFLIPTLPLYVLPALWMVQRATSSRAQLAAVCGVLVLVQGAAWGTDSVDRLQRAGDELQRTHALASFVRDQVPVGATVIVEDSVASSLRYRGEWLLLEDSLIRPGGVSKKAPRRPERTEAPRTHANPVQDGKTRVLRAGFTQAPPQERNRRLATELRRLQRERPEGLYLVARISQAVARRRAPLSLPLFDRGEGFKFVKAVTLPERVDRARHDRNGPLPGQREPIGQGLTDTEPLAPTAASTYAVYALAPAAQSMTSHLDQRSGLPTTNRP